MQLRKSCNNVRKKLSNIKKRLLICMSNCTNTTKFKMANKGLIEIPTFNLKITDYSDL